MKTWLCCTALLMVSMLAACAVDAASMVVMSTRGFARTSLLNNSEGKEAITAYRFEAPYGLAAGWRLPYLGFSKGEANTIQLKGVVAILELPEGATQRIEITFAGKKGVTIAPNTVAESDSIDQPALPGTVVIVWTLYGNQNPEGKLPYMTWGYVDHCDACLVGDIGTLPADKLGDEALLRNKNAPAPLFAGLPALIRSYQPMFISGRPHPSFMGTLMSVGFIGDSINIATGDYGRATPDDPFPTRGWNGRACGKDIPYVVFGQGGSNANGFVNAQHSALFNYIFGTGAGDAKVNCLVDGYGINTMRQIVKKRPQGNVWGKRQEVAAIALKLGLPYLHTTMTPMTEGWLVFDGEREASFRAFVAERKAFNEQVRRESKDIAGCAGIIDWGNVVEKDPVAADNIWQAGVDMDGIHPGTKGFQRMSEVAATTLIELRKTLAKRPIRVACVGDSLTSGFKMDKPEQDAYPAQLARLLGKGFDVRAFAVPGRTALRKSNLPLWKEQVFADAQAWQPDIVVICLGTNDCWPDTWQVLKSDFAGDFRDMVTLFANLPSKPQRWLCLPPPLFIDNGEVQKNILTNEVMPAIRAVAKETGSGLIDWHTTLQDRVELFMPDKVHPLPTGAAVMAQMVAESLQAYEPR